jgi:hypothetical protein
MVAHRCRSAPPPKPLERRLPAFGSNTSLLFRLGCPRGVLNPRTPSPTGLSYFIHVLPWTCDMAAQVREPGSVMGRSRVGAKHVWKACLEGRSQIRLGTELWQAQMLTVNCGWLSKCHELTGHQWSWFRVIANAVLLVAAQLGLVQRGWTLSVQDTQGFKHHLFLIAWCVDSTNNL